MLNLLTSNEKNVVLVAKQLETIVLTNEYIRGLIEGEGCFTFCTISRFSKKLDKKIRLKIPAFLLSMHCRDKELITAVKNHLKLKNTIYEYKKPPLISSNKEYKRGNQVMLIVREIGSLKNIIVPFCYKKLKGYKRKQFEEWIEKIGNDQAVPEVYKLIYRFCHSGYYDRNPKFLE